MRIKVLITALLLVLSVFRAATQNVEGLEFGTDETFDIMTWNIEWFPKSGQTTIDYVAEIIQQLQMDVIAIQEINSYLSFLQLLDLLDGYEGFAVESDNLELAFIFNAEVVEVLNIFRIFTGGSYSRPFPRRPLVMEIMFMNQNYIIINNHLKASGDGILDPEDPWDEETRRYDACVLLEEYISENHKNDRVILLGDLNDDIADSPPHNVFEVFLNKPDEYLFVDIEIAEGPFYHWSFPGWPSHLDHILINSALFNAVAGELTEVETLRIDDYLSGGWDEYDTYVSDHRPVALKFDPYATSVSEGNQFDFEQITVYPNPFSIFTNISIEPSVKWDMIKVFDFTGREVDLIANSGIQSKFQWDAGDLPEGIYTLILLSELLPVSNHKIVLYR
jgi:hypothetical protein